MKKQFLAIFAAAAMLSVSACSLEFEEKETNEEPETVQGDYAASVFLKKDTKLWCDVEIPNEFGEVTAVNDSNFTTTKTAAVFTVYGAIGENNTFLTEENDYLRWIRNGVEYEVRKSRLTGEQGSILYEWILGQMSLDEANK